MLEPLAQDFIFCSSLKALASLAYIPPWAVQIQNPNPLFIALFTNNISTLEYITEQRHQKIKLHK